MKEFIRGLVTISSTLLVIHSFLKMLNFDMFLFDLMTYAMFIVCFGLSMVSILFLIWRPMVIQLAALAFVLLIAPLIQTPVNYIGFAFTRYAIIEQLENNQLILNENKSKPGYYRAYYTRPSYMPAVNNTSIKAVVHSDENFFVYFESYRPLFDFNGNSKGFLYSSIGDFPSGSQAYSYGGFKRISKHWFFSRTQPL
ncbi:hypothetical protein MKY84_04980 [Chryseomicrobium sp. FSL W7-1435]|uniref:hypothetical protein n=1 Tax=Chryseomicrobium sp. FSL W7-1435 TaxID=2921704 RepID=UPI00315A2195